MATFRPASKGPEAGRNIGICFEISIESKLKLYYHFFILGAL